MSSSNRVRLAYIEETTYGETPVVGDFREMKFISESLTGTPLTVESAEIRSDRQTSGQTNTGLELTGGTEVELSADQSIQDMIRFAMMDDTGTAASGTVANLDIDVGLGTIDTTNDFTVGDLAVGDMVQLKGFTNDVNNTVIKLTALAAGQVSFEGPETMVNEVSATATLERPLFYTIGTDELSMTISKEYLDLAGGGTRSLAYTGERVGEMAMNFAFGEIASGSFSMAGNGYSLEQPPITQARTVTAAGSDPALDASNGFGMLLVDNADIDVCMESLSFTLNNNLQARNCIGALAPKDQTLGSASVAIETSMHLGINSWNAFMQAKLDQSPVSISFFTQDYAGNGYAVDLFRVQLNFPDPSAGGRDQNVMIEASGTASYDSVNATTMRFYIIG